MKLLVVFPCFNEEETLEKVIPKFFDYFEKLISKSIVSPESRICFVDDGSSDNTWEIIEKFSQNYILGIKLSTNFGQIKALTAGFETFQNQFDYYLTLDVDLQDDFTIIEQMIVKSNEGFELVQGAKNDRSSDSFFKRLFANFFYRMVRFLGVKNLENTSDFRLISSNVLNAFLKYKEYHIYMKGVFPMVGFASTTIYFKRQERLAGETKYSFGKLVSLAWDIITSFSTRPLKIVLFIGFLSVFASVILLIWATANLVMGKTVSGWFSMISVITFFGGIQTFAIGLIGEYVGKIYMQTKNRPRFIIEEVIGED